MTTAMLVILVLAAVAIVALPLLREQAASDVVAELTTGQRERLALREERDAALAGLHELEFDRRTGKVAEADYLPLVAELRARAAAAIAALEGDATPAAGSPEHIAGHG